MTTPKRDITEVGAWLSLALGLIVFLTEASGSGQALENFDVTLHAGALSLTGGGLAGAALMVLAILHLPRHTHV